MIESLKYVLIIEKNINLVNGFIVLDKSSSGTLNFLSIKISSSSKNDSHSCGCFSKWSNIIEKIYDEHSLICLRHFQVKSFI